MNAMIENIERLHTTESGLERISRNLSIPADSAMERCRQMILDPAAAIERRGKNWYVTAGGCTLTVNAYSLTVITAHKE